MTFMFKITALAAVAVTALFSGSRPADAFFGPGCIPNLYNCNCTFRVPCPVRDGANLSERSATRASEEAETQMLRDVRRPTEEAMRSIGGNIATTVPGLNSIGLDISGIAAGDLSSLGLPGSFDDLGDEITSLGVDGNMLSALGQGELTPDTFVSLAESAGVDTGMLAGVGLDMGTIEAIAGGNLDINSMMSVAQNLGLEAGVLSDIGIDADLITGIANGDVEPGRIMQIAGNAGLDTGFLSDLGLDPATLANLPGMNGSDVMGLLQDAGFESSIISDLGLDAGMIGQIASGELPPTAINDLVEGTGIDPSAITIPGPDGPISLNSPSGRPASTRNTITIPASDVAGLQSLVDQSKRPRARPGGAGDSGGGGETGAGGSSGGIPGIGLPGGGSAGVPGSSGRGGAGETAGGAMFSAPDAATAAMCATDRTLVSVGEAPNAYGDDAANIDFAISGAALDVFPESVSEANSASRSTFGFGIGRAIQVRPLLVKAIESVSTFEEMMRESQTLQDDFIVNDTIKSQLLVAKAEKASLQTALASVRAAHALRTKVLSPVPNFPQNSRFEAAAAARAAQSDRMRRTEATNFSGAADSYGEIRSTVHEALHHHGLQRDAQIIRSGMPAVERTIDIHEDYKGFLVDLEEVIKEALEVLYLDPESAWEILRPELYAASGTYTDASKWSTGSSRALDISAVLTPQGEETKYGKRRPNPRYNELLARNNDEYDEPRFTRIEYTPYNYPTIDAYAASEGDPYKVIDPPEDFTSGAQADENEPDPAQAMHGVLQYYFATHRRVKWKGMLRRGNSSRAMTSMFWTEMTTNAPQCLSGPIRYTPGNLERRPELFDLDKNCNHLEWAGGDRGDFIDARELGGADAALWLSKISLEEVRRETGGPDAIRERMEQALREVRSSHAPVLLEMQGHGSTVAHIDDMVRTLENALGDPDFTQDFDMPVNTGR
mgnify:CR=1 FL=1